MTKSTKKKLIAIGICFVILVVSILGNTIAYFTDKQEVSNTFTSGNVEITLDEGEATLDSLNRVTVDPTKRVSANQSFGTLYPAQSFTKDPTITNTSTEAAYIAAKVIVSDGVVAGDNSVADVTDLKTIIGLEATNPTHIDIKKLLTGGILETATVYTDKAEAFAALGTANYVVYQGVENGNYVFYFFIKDAVATGAANKVVLFDKFSVPAAWDNAEMNHLKELKIDVKAFGVQTYSFDNSIKALEAAFPSEFSGFAPVNP